MREGEESISGTFELKKSLKISFDIFVSLSDNSAHKRAGKQKLHWIVKNYTLSVGKVIFSKQEGTEQFLGFTSRHFIKAV